MGIFDYFQIHESWLPDIPIDSFMNQYYLKDKYYIRFQTKDTPEQSLINYSLDEIGQLYQLNKFIWNPDIEWVFLKEKVKGKHELIDIKQQVFFTGSIHIYSDLWGSGAPDSGTYPSKVWKEFGECFVALIFKEGKLDNIQNFLLEEPIKYNGDTI